MIRFIEKDVKSGDERALNVLVRAAQLVRRSKEAVGNPVALLQKAAEDPKSGFIYSKDLDQFEITEKSLGVLGMITALYQAFQQISKAA